MTDPFGLTSHDILILKLLADERASGEIAELLAVSEPDARAQVSKVLSKLGANSEAQAVAIAITERLIGPLAGQAPS